MALRCTVTVAMMMLTIVTCSFSFVAAKLPKHEDYNLLCNACDATLVEIAKIVVKDEKKYGRETALANALDSICSNMMTFNVYDFPPPKMQKACNIIIGEYEQKIEKGFLSKQSHEEMKASVCKAACKNYDPAAPTKGSKMDTMMNGRPMNAEEDEDEL